MTQKGKNQKGKNWIFDKSEARNVSDKRASKFAVTLVVSYLTVEGVEPPWMYTYLIANDDIITDWLFSLSLNLCADLLSVPCVNSA